MVWLALLPIMWIIGSLVSQKLSSRIVLPIGMMLTLLIGFFGWGLSVQELSAAGLVGIFQGLEIMTIILGALLFLSVTKVTGVLDSLITSVRSLSPDPARQTLIIGFILGSFVEGIAGFGTPAMITAPILVSLGLPVATAVTLSLVFNSAAVSFGAAGTPIFALQNILSTPLENLPLWTSLGHSLAIILLPILGLILLRILPPHIPTRPNLWFAARIGLIYSASSMLTAWILGPELPSILAPLITLGLIVATSKVSPSTIRSKKLLPYVWIAGILLLTRIRFLPFREWLGSVSLTWESILGTAVKYSVTPLLNPGIIPFLPVVIAMIWLYRIPKSRNIIAENVAKIAKAAPALVSALILVRIYMVSEISTDLGMITTIAQPLTTFGPEVAIASSALIGALGSFLTGSATVSNILMGPLQVQTAELLELSPVLILSLQAVGSAIGNMISIGNIIAVGTVVHMSQSEGTILKQNIPIVFGYATIATITLTLISWILS